MLFRKNTRHKPFERCLDQAPLQASLRQWFASEPGQAYLQAEKQQLDNTLPDLFGYYLIQVGEVAETDLLTTSRVSRRHVVGLQPGVSSDLQATSWALPFKTDTIDVVILPHTLDFTPYPHQVLREVERILIPEGHVVITGFNPLSLWQLWRWSLGWRRQPPWCGHFFGQFRLRDWLTLLGFDVTHKQYFFYRPPVRNARLMQRLGFMEKLGQRLWPIAGAGYMLVARKRVETLTPIRQKWSTRKKVVSSGLVESRLSHQERKEAVSD